MVYILCHSSKEICRGSLADCIDKWQMAKDDPPGVFYILQVERILALPITKNNANIEQIKQIIKLEDNKLTVEYTIVNKIEPLK